MTQEDKELLLKDLCARLPYGVLCKSGNEILLLKDVYIDGSVGNEGQLRLGNCKYGGIYRSIDEVKPYLRPLSSMTEEEEADLEAYSKQELDKYADNVLKHADKDTTRYSKIILIYKDIDWYNKNHFDYRGLIPKDLALEASEGMYNN